MSVGNVVDIDNNIDDYTFLNNNCNDSCNSICNNKFDNNCDNICNNNSNNCCNNSCYASVLQVSFEIFEGNGNVFAIINERINSIPNDETRSELSKEICNSNQIHNKRIDGLLFLQPSNVADIKMRIFEKDGSESDMCGNGLRCIAKYLEQKSAIRNPKINIETNSGIFLTEVIGDTVKVDMGFPQDPLKYVNLQKAAFNVLTQFCIAFTYKNHIIYLLNSGEPHGVIIVDDIDHIDLTAFLDFIQNKELFPFGINLNAMQIINDKTIRIRTLERGLWATTLCCGTGSTSCATLMWLLNTHHNNSNNPNNPNNPNEIKVISDGGKLYIKFSKNKIWMRGTARRIGCLNYQMTKMNGAVP